MSISEGIKAAVGERLTAYVLEECAKVCRELLDTTPTVAQIQAAFNRREAELNKSTKPRTRARLSADNPASQGYWRDAIVKALQESDGPIPVAKLREIVGVEKYSTSPREYKAFYNCVGNLARSESSQVHMVEGPEGSEYYWEE